MLEVTNNPQLLLQWPSKTQASQNRRLQLFRSCTGSRAPRTDRTLTVQRARRWREISYSHINMSSNLTKHPTWEKMHATK